MAWSKAKTAVAVVCAAGCIWAVRALRPAPTGPPPDIRGAWEGVDFGKRGYKGRGSQRSRVILKLYESNGVYFSTWDYIDVEKTDAWRDVIRDVVYKFPKLRFNEEPWGTRNAIVNDDGSIMTIGSGDDLMVMERTKNPDTGPEQLTESDYAPRAGSDLQGCWRGGMGDQSLTWKISDPPGGGRRAEFEVPGIGADHWLVSVAYDPPIVKLKLVKGRATFKGTINGAKMTGSFGDTNVYIFDRVDSGDGHLPEGNISVSDPAVDLQGHWRAVLPVKTGELRCQPRDLNIARLPDGTFSATMARPFLIGYDGLIAATAFHHDATQVRIEWKPLDITFDGQFEDGKLAGKWSEGGETYRIKFERRP